MTGKKRKPARRRRVATATEELRQTIDALCGELAACVERLDRLGPPPPAVAAELDELRRVSEERHQHLLRAEVGLADRDRRIEQLTNRIRHLQGRLTATDDSGRWLRTRLTPDQQADQDQARAKQTAYRDLAERLADVVAEVVPADATVLVVSKGDDRLLELGGRRALHFPSTEAGVYLGYHPKDSRAAIAYLEEAMRQGAGYLVLPETAGWWLDHYADFARRLETEGRCLRREPGTCHVFALDAGAVRDRDATPPVPGGLDELQAVLEALEFELGRPPTVLDWGSGLPLADRPGRGVVFSPPGNGPALPYLDRTADVVVWRDGGDRGEARRVARHVLATVAEPAPARGEPAAPATRRLTIDWLTREPTGTADASIIIPCYNGAAITEACLDAVAATLPHGFLGEIIVFDDGSTDDTRRRVRQWTRRDPRVRLLWRRRNAGFVDACNRAAKAATRDLLVFLNNDTVPAPGWLTALFDTFRRFPEAGAVGGKLVLPDGTLQEAGGVVFSDGSAANFCRGERDLESPLVNFVREVDYCSGALLATPRRLFSTLRGFDTRYRPAYYEDVDYCFKVRQSGRRVYYQPRSRVTHQEGASCGTDLTKGVKRYQSRHRRTFVERWKTHLERQPAPPPDGQPPDWPRLVGRGTAAAVEGA